MTASQYHRVVLKLSGEAFADRSIGYGIDAEVVQRIAKLGITLEAVLPQEPDEEGPRRLVLMPGGATPAIGIQLANRHGARRVVRLDPMTGFPRVESVN